MLSPKARKASFLAIFTLLAILVTHPEWVSGQKCGCTPHECCSRYGYCGTGDAYCGNGCRSGGCYSSQNSRRSANRNRVSAVVTDGFFNGILDQADGGCPGKGFYTWDAFLEALSSFPEFGSVGSEDDSKREIAAFFAHVTLESGYMCHIEEINGPSKAEHGEYCDSQNTQYPCKLGMGYYGRGPIQLSWNYNYGTAGESIGFDGLNDPDVVARDPVISFKTALWFWMNQCHQIITSGQGFGGTIRAINGPRECNGMDPSTVSVRVGYYREYCHKLGVDPGTNLGC